MIPENIYDASSRSHPLPGPGQSISTSELDIPLFFFRPSLREEVIHQNYSRSFSVKDYKKIPYREFSVSALRQLANRVAKTISNSIEENVSNHELIHKIIYGEHLPCIRIPEITPIDVAKKKATCPKYIFNCLRGIKLQANNQCAMDNEEFNHICCLRNVLYLKLQDLAHQNHLESKFLSNGDYKISVADVQRTHYQKFSELYVRVKAMESIAEENGWTWSMITLTCPSNFHPSPSKGKCSWDKSTPKEGHNFLSKLWRNIQRSLSNKGILPGVKYFGLRVVEPHEDGCPHWHILIFHSPSCYPVITDEVKKRFNWSDIAADIKCDLPVYFDSKGLGENKASAATYLFPYIMKNIPAESNQLSFFHDEAPNPNCMKSSTLTLLRVDAWRRTYKIRAFAFFGVNGSITLWRELRRLKTIKKSSELSGGLKKIASLTWKNDFKSFFKAISLDEETPTLAKETRVNKYGEIYSIVVGIKYKEELIKTRNIFSITTNKTKSNLYSERALNHSYPSNLLIELVNIEFTEKILKHH